MANKLFKKSLNVNQVLPPQLIIKGADSHLYRLGLSLFECRTKIKRKLFYHPLFITIINTIGLIKHILTLLIDVGSTDNHLIIGDNDYFCQAIGVMAFGSVICCGIILGSQLINVYNKWKDIKPDLRVFEMMAGFRSPNSIGLKDKQIIAKLIRFAKKVFKIVDLSTTSINFNTYRIFFAIFCTRQNSFGFIVSNLLRLTWAIFYGIWMAHLIKIWYYQILYFVILCYYLHLKMSQTDRRLINKEKNPRKIVKEFTDVYQEISENNSNYWSKFLLVIYSTVSLLIATDYFFSLFVKDNENTMLKLMLSSYAFFNSMAQLLTIGFSSLIYNDCKRTYRLLNSYVHSVKRINWAKNKTPTAPMAPMAPTTPTTPTTPTARMAPTTHTALTTPTNTKYYLTFIKIIQIFCGTEILNNFSTKQDIQIL